MHRDGHAAHTPATPTPGQPPAPKHPPGHSAHGAHDHHAMMVADFRRRFWVSVVFTVPAVVLAEMIQHWLGVPETLHFPGDIHVEWAVGSAFFFYGGWPFLKGLKKELADLKPGMMTLIALAITVAYVYSSAVAFGLPGNVFFWELATLST